MSSSSRASSDQQLPGARLGFAGMGFFGDARCATRGTNWECSQLPTQGVAQAELRELVASLGAEIVACTLCGAQG